MEMNKIPSKRLFHRRLSSKILSRMLLISGLLGLWASSILFVYEKVKCPPPPQEFYYESLFPIDTLVSRCWEFEGFQFYLKHISGEVFDWRQAFTVAHINASDESIFLFYTHRLIDELGAVPIKLFDDLEEDGEKEFWLYVLAETGEGAAFNKFEKLKVKFTGDSLIYPFLYGTY